ncbi:MAG: tetratricopeptide repeat protein, partial [Chloroflexota bacterium]
MKLQLGPPPVIRRTSLLDRVLHRRERQGTLTPIDTRPAPPGSTEHQISESPIGYQADALPSESRLYLEARQLIKRRAWGRAQRALEEAIRDEPDCPGVLDLTSVRTIRRALRRVARWPSDVEAHLDLGRACFDLDLGADALAEFTTVQRVAPRRYEGFALAALEYLYRGEYTRAMTTWLRARDLNPELPELDEV